MKCYYGYTTNDLIVEIIKEICGVMDTPENRPLSENFMMEITAQETRFGTIPDHSDTVGIGLTQFDPPGFEDLKINSKYFDLVMDTWGIDFRKVQLEHLKYSPFLAELSTRLKIKRVPASIPSGRKSRFVYYKRHYNSFDGAATRDEYFEKITWLRNNISAYRDNEPFYS